MLKKVKIAIVSGGLSNERDVSIKTGQQVYDNLPDDVYDKNFVEISKDGRWLLKCGGDLIEKSKQKDDATQSLTIMDSQGGITKNDLQQFDVIFLALHGKYGEDGKIQSILDILKIPYTGSGVLASSLGMNKSMASEFVSGIGIKIPKYILINKKTEIKKVKAEILDSIYYPCIVKPNESGSSIGISLVEYEDGIDKAISEAFAEDSQVVIEEYIAGREITCGVLGNSNRTELEALPPAEIITESKFFDYDAKYFSEKTREVSPAEISEEQTAIVQEMAKKIHLKFGCDGLSRTDFILKDNEFYFLEINTLPGLTEQSLCPKEAKAAGMTFAQFLDKQIKLAIEKEQ